MAGYEDIYRIGAKALALADFSVSKLGAVAKTAT